jgi:hypothetical protein
MMTAQEVFVGAMPAYMGLIIDKPLYDDFSKREQEAMQHLKQSIKPIILLLRI